MTNTQTTKHTPGPWEMVEATGSIPIKGADGKTIANVKLGSNDLDNARLIKVAPDMLGALKEANLTLSRLYEGRDGGEMPAVVNLVRAAISAAESK